MMSQQLLGGGIALSGAGLSRRHLSATSAAVRVDPVRLFPSMVPGATSSNRWSSRAGLLARAQKEGGNAPADGTSKTLANIDNLLGLEPEPEPEPEQEPAPAPEPVSIVGSTLHAATHPSAPFPTRESQPWLAGPCLLSHQFCPARLPSWLHMAPRSTTT